MMFTILAVILLIVEAFFGILIIRWLLSELWALIRKPKKRGLPIIMDKRKLFSDNEYSELYGYENTAEEDLEDEEG